MCTIEEVLEEPVFSEDTVLEYGLEIASKRKKKSKNPNRIFHSIYGSLPLVLSDQFEDLQTSQHSKVRLDKADNSRRGLQFFLMAHHWLWAKPKNALVMATMFGVAEKYCQGEHLWRWVRKIAALQEEKIVWEDRTDEELAIEKETFTISVDGTDFAIWEPKHPTLPIDKSYASHKFKNAGLRYEIAVSVKTGRCVWIHGPHKAGVHDMTIFRSELKGKIQPGEAVIADRGYQTSRADEAFMSTPNMHDSQAVAKFKSRVRCRQESFNGRLKKYSSMESIWKNTQEKHGWALRAVAVTVQYHLEHGQGLFEV